MASNDLSNLLMGGKGGDSRTRKEHSFQNAPPEKGSGNGRSGPGTTVLVLVIVALVASGVLGYFLSQLHQQQEAQLQAFQTQADKVNQALELIEQRLDGNADQIASLQSQVQVTMDRVGVTQRELGRARALAQQLKEEQEQNVAILKRDIQQKAEQVALLEQQSTQKFEGVDREITDVKQDVKQTREDLLDTMSELSELGVKVNEQGQLIATNRTGLDELRRRGERDFVEFALSKNVRTRVAGITIELQDTDGSPRDADLRIYANDTSMDRKDIPQNTPVNFYVGTERIPYELVLNEIGHKPDTCKGYISVPKGKLPKQGPPGLNSSGG